MVASGRVGATGERQKDAEAVLKRLGYAKVSPGRQAPAADASFWVQESGVPRRTFPVFVPAPPAKVEEGIDRWVATSRGQPGAPRAIFVVPNDHEAEAAWAHVLRAPGGGIDREVSILVVPPEPRAEPPAHFHLRTAEPAELLRLATGIVVGLFRRAQATEGASPVDFEEMLALLKARFGIDVERSLNVTSAEDALFLLYQLAQKDAYAPGDPGANLHLLVLKPTGPAARLPWFAA